MSPPILEILEYETRDRDVSWQGISLVDGDLFKSFMANDVASRLYDKTEAAEFELYLRSLANTGFANESLDKILAAQIPEQRDWAVGEAMAEAFLTSKHNVTWPWNMERDKRTPRASLPGADLVGFQLNGNDARLVLGEVKSSNELKTPPGVMNGRGGMLYRA
jgi:hypothetical protein